jgi:hypothetical protein
MSDETKKMSEAKRCPSCGFTTIVEDGHGNFVCSFIGCKNPTKITEKVSKAKGAPTIKTMDNDLFWHAYLEKGEQICLEAIEKLICKNAANELQVESKGETK